MRTQTPSISLLQLTFSFLTTYQFVRADPIPHPSEQAGFTYNDLFARYDCSGTTCGYYGQLCCGAGSGCFTDARTVVSCTSTAAAALAAGNTAAGGYWQYYTTTFTQTDLRTVTSTMSTYFAGGANAAPTGNAQCNYALNQTPCGSICCASDQYCFSSGQCAPAGNAGSSGFYMTYTPPATMTGTMTGTATAGAPLRPTSSGITTATATNTPTTTVAFIPPVVTGANVTLSGMEVSASSGLSGGAIAGIVIGVLLGLGLLGFILFCCCVKGLIDGCLACFGFGKKKERVTEVDEYERYSHHTAGGPKRTWYGAPIRTSKPAPKKEHHEGRNILAVLGGLGALWAVLGLKRRHDKQERKEERRNEGYSEYSYSEDYYTSASSESSDRRTRDDRRERSQSRRGQSTSRR